MKLRQAKKIMKNVRMYTGMIWVYGPGRVDKAKDRMLRYYARGNERFKMALQLMRADPLKFAKLLKLAQNEINSRI